MARIAPKQLKLVGGMVAVMLVALTMGYWLLWRHWGGFQTMIGDEFVRQAGAATLDT